MGPLVVEVLRSDTCNIQALDLRNNVLGGPVITQAIKFNKSLTSLDITGNPIEDDGLWTIGGLLLEEDCQCQLRSISTYAFEVKEAMAEMSLQDASLDTGAVRLLFGVLKFNDSITNLDLSGAGVSASAAKDLALALQVNTTLKRLDLSSNAISTISSTRAPTRTPRTREKKHDTSGPRRSRTRCAERVARGGDARGRQVPRDVPQGHGQGEGARPPRRAYTHLSAIFSGRSSRATRRSPT